MSGFENFHKSKLNRKRKHYEITELTWNNYTLRSERAGQQEKFNTCWRAANIISKH